MADSTARLCLTMIVKDEAAIIERCLSAAAPWIDAYAVHDTGSNHGTPDLVTSFFSERGVPGRVTHSNFHDFAQARDDSLDAALASPFTADVDYLLLCDADMELVVDDPGFRTGLTAGAYLMDQLATGLRYANLRLVRRDLPARYVGAPEHLDLAGGTRETLTGAWFRDHAEGSSREVKFERDLTLLRAGLAAEPDNLRYVFYLAQTLRDLSRSTRPSTPTWTAPPSVAGNKRSGTRTTSRDAARTRQQPQRHPQLLCHHLQLRPPHNPAFELSASSSTTAVSLAHIFAAAVSAICNDILLVQQLLRLTAS